MASPNILTTVKEGKIMKLSTVLRRALEERNIKTITHAAAVFGISQESVRLILYRGRIPKDSTLIRIADSLGLDPSVLLTAAHRQKIPRELRQHMLPVAPPKQGDWTQKRKWPLSQEQCEYLDKELKPHEIQLIRKCRQLTSEEKQNVISYIDFQFASNRVPAPAPPLSETTTQ